MVVEDEHHQNRKELAKRTFLGALLISGLIWGYYVTAHMPGLLGRERPPFHVIGVGKSILPSVAIGLAVSLWLNLVAANWHRIGKLFRPTRGKVIGAVVLGLLAPFGVFSWIPMVNFFTLIFFRTVMFENVVTAIYAIAFQSAFFLSGYLLACPLVSGLKHRVARVSGFFVVWWAAYSVFILWFGVISGRV